MFKKEKLKLIVYIALTIIIITAMILISVFTREKSLLQRQRDANTPRELLDVIDHTHTVNNN